MSTDNATTTTAENEGDLPILLHQTSNPSAPRITILLPTDATPPSSANTLRRLASDATAIPFDSLRLIYRGKIIAAGDGGDVVAEHKLEEGCVVHCLGKAAGPPAASAAAAGSAAASTTAAVGGSRPVGSSVIPPPAAASSTSTSTTTTSSSAPLPTALAALRTASPTPDAYVAALTTLSKLLGNIASHPTVEKYRRVKRANPAFQKRLGGLGGGHAVMLAVGFAVELVEGAEHYVLVANAEAWTKLVDSQKVVEEALVEAKRVTAGSGSGGVSGVSGGMGGMGGAGASPFGTGMPPAGGGMPGLPGMGMPGLPGGMPGGDMAAMMNSPQMQAAAAEMMSDPQALRSVLQNPMVRQTMESDPRFAGNPMARMALERMTNDPQALQRMSQMMSDPHTRQMMMNMQNAMNTNGGDGGMGGGGMGAGTGIGAAGTPPNPAQLAEQMRLMQQMMGAMGGAGAGAGAGGTGMPPQPSSAGANNTASGSTGQQQQQQQQNNSNNGGNSGGGNNDDEMTEEEMIQEAIRRSLNEN